jgi:NAD-dependent dihydropyrimidine dehydrogenase PreA subunit
VIELISSDRCIDCDLCVKVCPTNVFDAVPGDHPLIARQGDCQTCYLCEAYCPVDAMFVAPVTTPVASDSVFLDEEHLIETGLLGKYRRDLGWSKGLRPSAGTDDGWRLFSQFASRLATTPPPAAPPGSTAATVGPEGEGAAAVRREAELAGS